MFLKEFNHPFNDQLQLYMHIIIIYIYISLGHQEEASQTQACMQSPMAQSVLNTGVDRDRVKNVIERRLRDKGMGWIIRHLTNSTPFKTYFPLNEAGY